MRICAKGYSESTSKPEICQLQVPFLVDEQILRLQISVEDPMAVTVSDPLNQLAHKLLNHRLSQPESTNLRSCAVGQGLASAAVTGR